jgi:Zn-dependent peptidase ImmA (M78 family)
VRGRSLAKTKAKKLLSQLGIKVENVDVKKAKRLSINVEDVANLLNIKVSRYPFSDDVSGVFFKKGSQLFLGVNENHHEHRQRFTIAHEIGHYILHANETLHYDVRSELESVHFRAENISNVGEIEANHFAAELLMPEDIVYRCIQSGMHSIKELAEVFNVSENAMRYRLTNLGLL